MLIQEYQSDVSNQIQIKYIHSIQFQISTQSLDFFAPPVLQIMIKDEAERCSTLVSPVSITTLNFYQFEDKVGPEVAEKFANMPENDFDIVVPSNSAEEVLRS